MLKRKTRSIWGKSGFPLEQRLRHNRFLIHVSPVRVRPGALHLIQRSCSRWRNLRRLRSDDFRLQCQTVRMLVCLLRRVKAAARVASDPSLWVPKCDSNLAKSGLPMDPLLLTHPPGETGPVVWWIGKSRDVKKSITPIGRSGTSIKSKTPHFADLRRYLGAYLWRTRPIASSLKPLKLVRRPAPNSQTYICSDMTLSLLRTCSNQPGPMEPFYASSPR